MEASVTLQAFVLTISYVLVATLIHAFIVTLAGSARQFLEDKKRRIIARRILSLALVGIAGWFAFTTG